MENKKEPMYATEVAKEWNFDSEVDKLAKLVDEDNLNSYYDMKEILCIVKELNSNVKDIKQELAHFFNKEETKK